MDEPHQESFRAQVERLVAAGKLTAGEAASLLEGGGEEETAPRPDSPDGFSPEEASRPADTLSDLELPVGGYSLTVIHDPALSRPHLSANRDGELELQTTPTGWRVVRVGRPDPQGQTLRAILTMPSMPRHVRARVEGGHLTLPDMTGEMVAEVSGGDVRMGRAASLQAQVNGGHLSAAGVTGPAHLKVNGGHLTLEGGQALNASVNGGHLRWTGQLTGGEHRLEVNAGNATLHLLPGSSVQVGAEVTVGAFRADFPTHRSGGLLNTRHTGQLGSGDGQLSCRVAAGQIKVVTA